MKRLFISVEIPENVKREVLKIQNSFPEFYGKKTELENLHLTLKFLGEISDEKVEEVKERLRRINLEEIETVIDEIGVFSESFVRIVWLHLKGAEKLQEIVDESLEDIFPREKRFMSHLTIARIKKIKDTKYFLDELGKIEIPKLRFTVDKFYLKESVLRKEGPVYSVIEVYGLKNIT